MKYLIATIAVAAAMLAGSWSDGSAAAADWSSSREAAAKVAPKDGCAKVTVKRFSSRGAFGGVFGFQVRPLCGGSWPQVTQCWSHYPGGYWEGFFGYDGGPGSSPRYWTSWWQASYNLCG